MKQEELGILLRGYHSSEDLYHLLRSVLGNSDFKTFVYRHYRSVGNVRDFASLASMSIRTFQRRFKSEFRKPVQEWLTERRMENILRELRSTDAGIGHIAAKYGFGTASYFSSYCKQYFGQTPTELRHGAPPDVPIKASSPDVSDTPEGGGADGVESPRGGLKRGNRTYKS